VAKRVRHPGGPGAKRVSPPAADCLCRASDRLTTQGLLPGSRRGRLGRWEQGALVAGRLLTSALAQSRGRPAVGPGRCAWPAPPHPSVAQDERTAIIEAAQSGHEKVVERLVAAKAEVNSATKVRYEARADTTRPQPAMRPAATGVAAGMMRAWKTLRARSLGSTP
jgi:hypothetical protein